MTTSNLSALVFACSLIHFWGGRFIWRRGYHFAGGCFVLNGVVMFAFAVSLLRNGAPNG